MICTSLFYKHFKFKKLFACRIEKTILSKNKKTLLLSILHTCTKNKEKINKLTTFWLSRFCLECAAAPRNETKGKTSQSIRGKMGGRVKTAKRCERKIDAENLPNTKGWFFFLFLWKMKTNLFRESQVFYLCSCEQTSR